MENTIPRHVSNHLRNMESVYPVITLTGPRQSGKTTLCRMLFDRLPYANLEEPDTRAFALEDPRGFLSGFPKGGVIDEFQRAPDISSYIQGIVDDPSFNGTFVLTGSQNLSVRNTVSQSLAGRTALVTLLPFSYPEIAERMTSDSLSKIMVTGFYPRIHDRKINPSIAMADYIATYVERDLRQLSLVRNLTVFQTFLRLCAGRTGQLLKLESLGNDAGVSHATAREWISILEASYIAFRLPPFFSNIRKRLIKSPKLYFYDVGLAAYLLGIKTEKEMATHPLRGMLFENMIVVELFKYFLNDGTTPDISFYRDTNGNEVDAVIVQSNKHIPIEIKSAATISSSFFAGLDRFTKTIPTATNPMLIYGGNNTHERNQIQVANLATLAAQLDKIV